MVRYPQLFGNNGHVLSEDFIVSGTDLASVIFDIANVTDYIDPEYILDDSISWVQDVVNDINNITTMDNNCCEYRFSDMYNSHMIVMKDWKYIYRANDLVETTNEIYNAYPYWYDHEQLYYLPNDPTEQNNLIHNYNESRLYSDILNKMQSMMRKYIKNVVCPIDECKMPDITFMKMPTMQPTQMISTSNVNDKSDDEESEVREEVAYIMVGVVGCAVIFIMAMMMICVCHRRKRKVNVDGGYNELIDLVNVQYKNNRLNSKIGFDTSSH